MSGNDYGRVIYLVLLTGAIVGFFLMQNRRNLGKLAQQAAVWGLIFLGAIAAIGLWSDIRSTVMPRQAVFGDRGRIEVPRAPDGHFYLTAKLNGTPVRFIVDTGASQLVLSRRDAARIGIDPANLQFTGMAGTANGRVRTAPIRIAKLEIGPISDRNVRASVNGGDLNSSLLGMGYLQRFSKFEITGDTLILTR